MNNPGGTGHEGGEMPGLLWDSDSINMSGFVIYRD
jgi:hypothetical protein